MGGCGAGGEAGLADDLLRLSFILHRVVRRYVGRTVPSLPMPQAELLVTVLLNPGISVNDAAAQMHVAANTVSTLVNQTVAAGLLDRQTDPGDRRAARLVLTEAAEKHLALWRDCACEFVDAGITRLDEGDRTALDRGVPALESLVRELGEATA
jgi:DNA-binding MarR family transcriptional regulator